MYPITEFLLNFGKSLGLESFTDEAGNVIIRKPASPGLENRKGVILQAHMDMVPQQNSGKAHNFIEQPIHAYVDGEWIKAKDTTLGADNGLGIAAIMAVLEDKTLKHGPLEALITKDEETGMEGAFGLKAGVLNGEILLNLDSEEEGDLYIGCAGGIDMECGREYDEEDALEDEIGFKIIISGLKGGHSGLDINAGRANANKLMACFLYNCFELEASLVSWEGGDMRNAIPREAQAVIGVSKSDKGRFFEIVKETQSIFQEIHGWAEPSLQLTAEPVEMPKKIMHPDMKDHLIQAVYACPNGVIRMIPTIPDTVETSSNLAIVRAGEGNITVHLLLRSSSDTMKQDLVNRISSCFELGAMWTQESGAYSGWQPNVNSPVLQTMKTAYKGLFGKEPAVKVIHAGLECGIIGAAMPGLDMVSFGPTLRSPHSPDERAHIPSVEKFYALLTATLEQIPAKA